MALYVHQGFIDTHIDTHLKSLGKKTNEEQMHICLQTKIVKIKLRIYHMFSPAGIHSTFC